MPQPSEVKRLPRYEMRVDCTSYCYGGSPEPERTDEKYPQFHDWSEPCEYCKAEDVAKLEESHAEVVAERDEAVTLLRELRHRSGHVAVLSTVKKVDAFLSRTALANAKEVG